VSDTAATTDATTTDATTTDATTTDATAPTSGATTDAPVAACQCDDPVVHEGTLEVAGLAAYAGKCLVEVTDGLELRDIVDPAVLAPLANLERVGWLSLSSSPGLVDLASFGCLREVGSSHSTTTPRSSTSAPSPGSSPPSASTSTHPRSPRSRPSLPGIMGSAPSPSATSRS
jgi:hypothetical protein